MNPEELAAENRRLRALLRRREEENVGLAKKMDRLEEENSSLTEENRDLKEVINRAKDIRPWARPNRDNVRQMAKKALLDIVKAPGGWVVKMGNRIGKKFKRLRDIWLILTKESWNLHDEFLPYADESSGTQSAQKDKAVYNARASAPIIIPTRAPQRAQATQPAPAPQPTPVTRTPLEIAQIETLRSQWRMFPSMRHVLEEEMARFGKLISI